MKKNKIRVIIVVVLLLIIFVLGIFLFNNLLNYLLVLEKQELDVNVIVMNRTGLSINGTALVFGGVIPGGSSTKKINITNTHGQDVRVKIYTKGEMKESLIISENNFILEKEENKEIIFTISIPRGTEYREYNSKVIIVIQRKFF